MKLIALACIAAWLVLGTGCLWASKQSDSVVGIDTRVMLGDHGHVDGADVGITGGFAGVYADVDASVRSVDRAGDPNTYRAGGVGLALRASLFGILATKHEIDRYLDFGAAAGASFDLAFGVPPHDVAGLGTAWYGAWVDIGTVPLHNGYLALTGAIHRDAFSDPWTDRTELLIGLAWRQREPLKDEPHWRD